ncbi:hypothetical protein J4526_02645 [Desulfurococcaceae archaeon MEX13E-LK6-19]|nr:hypothetical protein J4526_02645 [Desulfurococcaceae archaeon MEX13E-LK6-19]
MGKSVVVKIDIGKYKYVDVPLDDAIRLLEKIISVRGETRDLMESLRYLKNFDEFYSYMKKKFKDFITPPKEPKDLVMGKVVVDKVKLYVEDNDKRVIIVFDRRVDVSFIKEMLESIGYEDVEIQKELF